MATLPSASDPKLWGTKYNEFLRIEHKADGTHEDITCDGITATGMWIDVSSYGAVGDGTTDDTVALQAAIDAAAYGKVILPAGTYKFSQLKFNNPIIFGGEGSVAGRWWFNAEAFAGTKLLHDGTENPAILIGGDSDSVLKTANPYYFVEGVCLQNMYIYPTDDTANVGILVDGSDTLDATRGVARDITFRNIAVGNFGSNCLKIMGDAFDVRAFSCGFYTDNANVIYSVSASSVYGPHSPGQLQFYDCYVTADAPYWNYYGNGFQLHGGGIAYGNGMYCRSYCQMFGTHIEGLTADANTIGVQITGQYCNIQPTIIAGHDTGIVIGTDGGTDPARSYFIATTIAVATTGIKIENGGDRTGAGVVNFSTVTTNIEDQRVTEDGAHGSFSLLNNRITVKAEYAGGAVSDGSFTAQSVTVTGAALGDFADASFSADIADVQMNAVVTATNTVTVTFYNNTGGSVTPVGDIYIRVRKK